MTLDLEVVRGFLRRHPDEAAPLIEQLSVAEGARVLGRVPADHAARVLERITAGPAAAILCALEPKVSGSVVSLLPVDVAARYLRRMAEPREAVLAELPEAKQRALGSMLRYPERSAGALMDPEVLALAEDLTVREATERVRVSADHARYNVYVTSRDDVLTGVVNLRELLLGEPTRRVGAIAHRDVMRLSATSDPLEIVSHPGWRKVHSLPVVDAEGVYLGAVRYATLRRLQDELLAKAVDAPATTQALGEVFWVGLGGMLDLLAGPRRE